MPSRPAPLLSDAPALAAVRRRWRLLAAFVAGLLSVSGFAPFEVWLAPLLTLGVLAALAASAASSREAFGYGFAWGWGAFLGGVSWLFVALHRFGGMPAPLAALAIALFCAYLALYPALAAALWRRFLPASETAAACAFAGWWLLGEWLRGSLFTGFPWLALGYSQTPPSPLAGYLPVLGVYVTGAVLALAAALLAALARRRLPAAPVLGSLAALAFVGISLQWMTWTEPEGETVRIELLQPNLAQELKWAPGQLDDILTDSLARVRRSFARDEAPALVVLPETALPTLFEYLPQDYVEALAAAAAAAGGDVLVGSFARDGEGRIYNAALSLGSAPSQFYAKHHLVPFGEYSPPFFDWFYALADIPMSDQTPGPAQQPPLALAGQQIAVNICYEDLFGAELLTSLPVASLMLNVSNLAWYGESWAQSQHLQIARVRALESGRPMLRATNTGMTALVMPDGKVSARLGEFVDGALRVEVRGYTGLTPYARLGDLSVLLAVLVLGGLGWRLRTP